MIALLKGKIAAKSADTVTVDVGGVGYEVFLSKKAAEKLPDVDTEITLQIHTHVTENALSLFGFTSEREKNLFRKLISVSGIGPKLANQVLSGLSANDLVAAILDRNLEALTAISGVGKKTAERLIVELRDKLTNFADNLEALGGPSATPLTHQTLTEVLSALVNLGYNRQAVEKTLSNAVFKPGATFGDMLKTSLGILGNQ